MSYLASDQQSAEHEPFFMKGDAPYILQGSGLQIVDLVHVSRFGKPVTLTTDVQIRHRVDSACDFIRQACQRGRRIYGVTTGFGGMSNIAIDLEESAELQNNLIWFLKAGAGRFLPIRDVRAAMLLRANSFLRGASGLRWELIERFIRFLNANITPCVRELGSICASGDLVPLASIAGAIIGANESFRVFFDGGQTDSISALKQLGISPLTLLPKEGLALVNGTSMSTGIAANCTYDARLMLALTFGAHALFIQGLRGSRESFSPFIHESKGHPGQIQAAKIMSDLLEGSKFLLEEHSSELMNRDGELAQDRYSIRCLPQFMGPILEGLSQIERQMKIEMNSVNDNPLIDVEAQAVYHGGNFLGEHIAIAMDCLRYYLGLLAKHLDAQISLLVQPEFSNGLPPSLVGNSERRVNMGLKGLQLAGNSIMPLIGFLGKPIADAFPTHAEQFNQNINSLAFASANLARQTIELYQQYIAICLMFGLQCVDLRSRITQSRYDAGMMLSPPTRILYETLYRVLGKIPSKTRPYVWNDNDQALDAHIECIASDIAKGGQLRDAIIGIWDSIGKPELE